MRKNWMFVIICSLITAGCAGRGGGPRTAVYPKTRVLPTSCDVAWPEMLGILNGAGFRLVAKDDAGQIARFMYLQPQLPPFVRTAGEADKLAIAGDGSAQRSGKLRIESAVLSLERASEGCEVKVSVSYQAQSGVWGRNWIAVESSGLLENRVLSELRIGDARNAGARQLAAQRGRPRGTGPAARLARSSQVTVIGGELPPEDISGASAYDLARQ
jgi:hypothetical protein